VAIGDLDVGRPREEPDARAAEPVDAYGALAGIGREQDHQPNDEEREHRGQHRHDDPAALHVGRGAGSS
jgi:hypothetical protein